METQVQVSKKITLVMDEEEAMWLQGYLQNYMAGNLESEPQDHADMRERFYKSLQDSLSEGHSE